MGSSGLVATLILPVLLLIQLGAGFAQNGDWYGYCCTDRTYCGDDCQSASCTESGSIPEPGGGNVGITKSFFDNIMSKVSSNCEGKGFYTYDAFVTAANAYTGFGTTGSNGVRKRELAAFFANVMQETGGFCYINEINPFQVYCRAGTPCASGKSYHGRGPLRLTWNYNYEVAGEDIGFDGINNPEVVGQDPIVSFKTAVWFWMKDSSCHQVITSGQGFGATIKAINGMECNGGNPAEVSSRVGYYKSFCQQLGVDPGANLSC